MISPALIYVLAVSGGFLAALIFVPLVKTLALSLKAVDQPAGERKIHGRPIPLLGGLAVFFSTFLVLFLFRYFHLANFAKIPDRFLWGIFLAGGLIMLGGFLDDKYDLKPWQQIIWPILAASAAIFSGVRIGYITNPLGGTDNAIVYLLPLTGIIISFGWLMAMMYATKFLDGLDGLVSGITVIAAAIIFLLSLDWDVKMSATGVWALILAGSSLGFLIFNWQPAKIFLGEGGSIFAGFILGVLSIVSGSKITATLLVMGLPLLDVVWVAIQRMLRKESPFSHADQKHLHYQLLILGLTRKESVLILYLTALAFGALAVFSRSLGKLVGLISLLILMIILALLIKNKKYGNKSQN